MCVKVLLRDDLDLEQHARVVNTAKLCALTGVGADLVRCCFEYVRATRNHVKLEEEVRDPE